MDTVALAIKRIQVHDPSAADWIEVSTTELINRSPVQQVLNWLRPGLPSLRRDAIEVRASDGLVAILIVQEQRER